MIFPCLILLCIIENYFLLHHNPGAQDRKKKGEEKHHGKREIDRVHHHGPKWIHRRKIYNLKISGYLLGVNPM